MVLVFLTNAAGVVLHRGKWVYRKLRLKYTIPFLLLMVYTVAGGLLFQHLEAEHDLEKRRNAAARLDRALYQLKVIYFLLLSAFVLQATLRTQNNSYCFRVD